MRLSVVSDEALRDILSAAVVEPQRELGLASEAPRPQGGAS